MPLKSADAENTARNIGPEGEATYVDVRTVAEFTEGRPKGRAINVPIEFYHPKTNQVHANDAFLLVVQHTLGATAPIIIGADEGPRATHAANKLAEAGFTEIEVLTNGMTAWQAAGLPVTRDNREGVSYVSLLTPARRAK